jgi:hypothetical protein
MKAAKLFIGMCVVLGVTACHKQSSDPKKDIVGSWESTDNKHMSLFLGAEGKAVRSYDYLSPSQVEVGTYALTVDPSGVNILTLTLRQPVFGATGQTKTTSYEAAVYANELILGAGAGKMSLARIPAKASP